MRYRISYLAIVHRKYSKSLKFTTKIILCITTKLTNLQNTLTTSTVKLQLLVYRNPLNLHWKWHTDRGAINAYLSQTYMYVSTTAHNEITNKTEIVIVSGFCEYCAILVVLLLLMGLCLLDHILYARNIFANRKF